MKNITEKLFDITHAMENINQGNANGVPYKITSWNEVNDKVNNSKNERRYYQCRKSNR